MKQIFTSNYAKHGTDPNAIAISIVPPPYYLGKSYYALAPTWDMVRGHKTGRITDDEYIEQYKALLEQRNITGEFLHELLPDEAILLCYEKAGDFCHRRIVAEMIEEFTKIKVLEISVPESVDYLSNFIII